MIEYLMQNAWQAWAVIAVASLILELMAGDFFIICFAIGALAAVVGSGIGLGIYVQLVLFALLSLASLFWVRPVARRYLRRGEDSRLSNAEALMGRRGRVVETVRAGGYGRVQIDGDVWKAVSLAPTDIAVGAIVSVVGRESTIITVKEAEPLHE